MKYTKEQLGFILYNNRSVEGVITNFLEESMDPSVLIDIEKKFDWCKSLYSNLEKMVEIDISLLNPIAEDLIVFPDNLKQSTHIINANIGIFSENELNFLKKRNIPDSIIKSAKLLGLSTIKDERVLDYIGATSHPILRTFLKDGIDEGGIIFPQFKNEELINCSIRRISDIGKLKYTLAVPDIPVWGLDDVNEGDEVWITEGLFDMYTLRYMNIKSASPSSAMWSGPQLYKLLDRKPSKVVIFCDNDRVGLKTGLVLTKFFNLMNIVSNTVHSKKCKDVSEHFLEKNLSFNYIEDIKITKKMVMDNNDNSFDFLKYLQKRKF